MTVEYRDETHVDPNKHYTTAEIAKMIREKKYGKDVRESIALFVESFDEVNANKVTREYVEEEVEKLNNRIKFITVTGIDKTVVRDVIEEVLKEKGLI